MEIMAADTGSHGAVDPMVYAPQRWEGLPEVDFYWLSTLQGRCIHISYHRYPWAHIRFVSAQPSARVTIGVRGLKRAHDALRYKLVLGHSSGATDRVNRVDIDLMLPNQKTSKIALYVGILLTSV